MKKRKKKVIGIMEKKKKKKKDEPRLAVDIVETHCVKFQVLHAVRFHELFINVGTFSSNRVDFGTKLARIARIFSMESGFQTTTTKKRIRKNMHTVGSA